MEKTRHKHKVIQKKHKGTAWQKQYFSNKGMRAWCIGRATWVNYKQEEAVKHNQGKGWWEFKSINNKLCSLVAAMGTRADGWFLKQPQDFCHAHFGPCHRQVSSMTIIAPLCSVRHAVISLWKILRVENTQAPKSLEVMSYNVLRPLFLFVCLKLKLGLQPIFLKGSSDAKFTLQVVWTKMCVEVCVRNHPIMIRNPPSVFFLIPILKFPFSNQAVLSALSEWRSSLQAPPTIIDWQDHLTLIGHPMAPLNSTVENQTYFMLVQKK